MNLNEIAGWASIISLILGTVSIFLSMYSVRKVNKFIVKNKDVSRNKVDVNGIGNKAAGRDFHDK